MFLLIWCLTFTLYCQHDCARTPASAQTRRNPLIYIHTKCMSLKIWHFEKHINGWESYFTCWHSCFADENLTQHKKKGKKRFLHGLQGTSEPSKSKNKPLMIVYYKYNSWLSVLIHVLYEKRRMYKYDVKVRWKSVTSAELVFPKYPPYCKHFLIPVSPADKFKTVLS